MRLVNNPCKSCEERHVGCHAECEKYAKAKADTEDARQKKQLYEEYNGYMSEYAKKVQRRMRNKKR